MGKTGESASSDSLSSFLHRKPSLHPSLFPFGVVRHLLVTHRRQFTGGVFTGVSMSVVAVSDDLSILIGQHLWSEFLDFFGWDVQGSADMGFTVAFRCERLDQGYLFSV